MLVLLGRDVGLSFLEDLLCNKVRGDGPHPIAEHLCFTLVLGLSSLAPYEGYCQPKRRCDVVPEAEKTL